MEPIPISSSDIRRVRVEGDPATSCPPAVAAEIERLGLYRRRAG